MINKPLQRKIPLRGLMAQPYGEFVQGDCSLSLEPLSELHSAYRVEVLLGKDRVK